MWVCKRGIFLKKHFSSPVGEPISYAALPVVARVCLLQHNGLEAIPIVNVGEQVSEGQLIAEKNGEQSVRMHSPVPGLVKKIASIILPNGRKTKVIEIKTGGMFHKNRQVHARSLDSFSRKRLLADLAMRGVVDHNFQAMPAHIQYDFLDPVQYLVVALADGDPYSAIQEQILAEHPQALVDGLLVLCKLLKPQSIVLCTHTEKQELLASFGSLVNDKVSPLECLVLPNIYPFYTEEMIKLHLYKQKNNTDVKEFSCLVVQPSLLLQLQQSVHLGLPCISRPMTIAGGAIARPANMFVRVGTPVQFLLEECGGFKRPVARVIMGSQQTGFSITDLSTPVGKDTSMILALTKKEIYDFPRTKCHNCGLCDAACPLHLSPCEAHKAILTHQVPLIKSYFLELCLTCGTCTHVCPAHIPLNTILANGKKIIEKERNPHC